MVEMHFNFKAGTLMALASASSSKLYYDMDEVLLYNNNVEENLLKIHNFLKNLYDVTKN